MMSAGDGSPSTPSGGSGGGGGGRARRASFSPTGQSLTTLFERTPTKQANNQAVGQTAFPGPIATAAANAQKRRRMSISTLGLSGSSPTAQTSPFSASTSASASAASRRESMSSAGTTMSAVSDDNAIEDGDAAVTPAASTNTPFTRRMSFGARALRDARGGAGSGKHLLISLGFWGGGGGGGVLSLFHEQVGANRVGCHRRIQLDRVCSFSGRTGFFYWNLSFFRYHRCCWRGCDGRRCGSHSSANSSRYRQPSSPSSSASSCSQDSCSTGSFPGTYPQRRFLHGLKVSSSIVIVDGAVRVDWSDSGDGTLGVYIYMCLDLCIICCFSSTYSVCLMFPPCHAYEYNLTPDPLTKKKID